MEYVLFSLSRIRKTENRWNSCVQRAQPDSIMVCPLFTDKSPDDDFLLAFIGVLDEL